MAHKFKQAAGITSVMHNILLDAFWQDIRREGDDSGNIIYEGFHWKHDAPTNDPNWEIQKYTWDGGVNVRLEGPLKGSWDDRRTLDWG